MKQEYKTTYNLFEVQLHGPNGPHVVIRRHSCGDQAIEDARNIGSVFSRRCVYRLKVVAKAFENIWDSSDLKASGLNPDHLGEKVQKHDFKKSSKRPNRKKAGKPV
jgi:hypothetical protein